MSVALKEIKSKNMVFLTKKNFSSFSKNHISRQKQLNYILKQHFANFVLFSVFSNIMTYTIYS
jgi:hypothetical protein